MSADNNKPNNSEGDLALDKRTKTKKPSLYRVIMLNDDYTPMEFVVLILQRFFGHNTQSAQKIMLHVHQKGVGVCGIYTYEVAEAKINQVMTFARQNEHPLQLQMEKE
ncbi:ATP-dependent Clp protease adapter ClpS [Alphaproteobacteria bacterium]|nr:ATP-dependent Clp protease adapter ClpS [Alphaproteobacteria bacterium]MDA9815747.1 ATP-dependent Clp protease adapter ClpS [Alphaproteobacteria bacterium]